MKLVFAALMIGMSSASVALADGKICGNGWPAFASCAADADHFIHICLDPSRTDGQAVVHTLDVQTKQIAEEVGVAYVSSVDKRIIVETNSPTFKNLTLQRMTMKAFGGERNYRQGVLGKSDDLSSFFCSVDDTLAAKIPVK